MKLKKWCKHMEFVPDFENYFIVEGYLNEFQGSGDTEGFNYCPICGKPRPKNKESK